MNNELQKIGFHNWFVDQMQQFDSEVFYPARIIQVNKDNYIIRNEYKEIKAEVTGKLLFNADSGTNMPAVGDWVLVQYFDDETRLIAEQYFAEDLKVLDYQF